MIIYWLPYYVEILGIRNYNVTAHLSEKYIRQILDSTISEYIRHVHTNCKKKTK